MPRHEFDIPHAPLRDHLEAQTLSSEEKNNRLASSFQLFVEGKIPIGEMSRRRSLYDKDYPAIQPKSIRQRSHIHPRIRKSG